MKFIDLTLPTPQHNLACEEALIEWCESGFEHEILRFWEPSEHFVVVGYSSKINQEVNLLFCQSSGVPVFRRLSGGGAVLQGPGCLNYALILPIGNSGPLTGITETNAFVLERHKSAVSQVIGPGVEIQGLSDLTIGQLKFSGNAQYRRRRFLLFHGTFLLQFDLELMEKFLPMPQRQSAYRRNRAHRDFLVNLNLSATSVKERLKAAWNATEELAPFPARRIEDLVAARYARPEWNFKFL